MSCCYTQPPHPLPHPVSLMSTQPHNNLVRKAHTVFNNKLAQHAVIHVSTHPTIIIATCNKAPLIHVHLGTKL